LVTPLYCHKCGTRLSADGLSCSTCGASQKRNDYVPTNLLQQEASLTGTGRLPAGRMLHQRYRLLHTIGQGGMGAVYVAQDTQLGDRLVAVKEMSMSKLTPQDVPQAVEQFRQEAHLLANLHHPNLPAIHEYFGENDRWYLVMSFIEGQNLQSALNAATGNKLPVNEVVRIGIELCEVLDYLHTHQPPIIFRDLKPLNIMVTPKGHICLIDFGIARHFKQEQTQDTAYYYSAGYAPPEQYGRSQTGPRSDIYSLGVTLHQMLSGQNPANTPFQFPHLQLVDPTLPPPLARLITQMLEMKEQDRPASVIGVKTQLENILTPRQIEPTRRAVNEQVEQAYAASEEHEVERVKKGQVGPAGKLQPTPSYEGYLDRILTCRDCGQRFTFTASEQESFATRGLTTAPARCPECRRKARRMATEEHGVERAKKGQVGSAGKLQPTTSYEGYQDRILTCRDCGQKFTFTASEQKSFATRGLTNAPVRCPECRKAHRIDSASNQRPRGGSSD
jgi:serine/threonine protein kinase